ncbi:MAG TPA: LuxR C-terminal-related transcriptional regulator [Acidobacteriaceae bacterium]|nr:LuxR C-terminal-related transcriptional regulator [Acidobacteriaceae bacterium]
MLHLVGQIYDAAMDPVAMQRLPLAVAQHFGSESCLFHFCYKPTRVGAAIPENSRLPIGTANFDLKACTAYAEYYHKRNEWYARGWKKGFPVVVLGDELMSTQEMLRTEWSDYCKLTGMFELIGAQCLITEDLIGAIGIHRPQGALAFDETDRRMMNFVLPHLHRAFQIYERLEIAAARSALAIDVLDSLSVGLILVGTDFRLIFASDLADRVLRTGQYFSSVGGRLRTARSRNGVRLQRLIIDSVRTSAGLMGSAGGTVQLDGDKGTSLSLLVSPLRMASLGFGLMQPAAILLFADPDAKALAPEQKLRQAFRLTPAELQLLTGLLNGQKLAEYAKSVGITYGTARIHLKHLLQKTDCHSQVDLVRTILKNPLARIGSPFDDPASSS